MSTQNNISNQALLTTSSPSFTAVKGGNIQVTGNSVTSTDTNGNITISPNGSGTVTITTDVKFDNMVTQNCILVGDFETNPWQRATSFVAVANDAYTADRFKVNYVTSAVTTISKFADGPSIAQSTIYTNNCLQVAVTTADASIATGDYYAVLQPIEGYNFQPIAQQNFTISFWVKSVKTGIYCVSFANAGKDRSYVAEYTINATNTWEFKTVTISASPVAGTWNYINGVGLYVRFALAAGATFQTTANAWNTGDFYSTSNQVNGLDANTNTFRLALIQVERGTLANAFSQPDVQTVLASCQRYYQKTFALGVAPVQNVGSALGCIRYCAQTNGIKTNGAQWQYAETMRAAPAVTYYSPFAATSNWWNLTGSAGSGVPSTAPSGAAETNTLVLNPQVVGDNVGEILAIHISADAELI